MRFASFEIAIAILKINVIYKKSINEIYVINKVLDPYMRTSNYNENLEIACNKIFK